MLAKQPHAKLFLATDPPAHEQVIALFHRWIQHKRGDELLIDVHNYSHVPGGPGIILLAHQSYRCLDSGADRYGLWYRARRGERLEAELGWRSALHKAIATCQWLEEDSDGAIRFSGASVRLGFDDRLNAPNDEATRASLQPVLTKLAGELFDGEVRVEAAMDARAGLSLELCGAEQSLAALAARL